MPMLVNALLIDTALNPRHYTSTAWHIACQPFTRHCSTSGSYLAIFLSCVDSRFSSPGTQSSHIITFFVEFEDITISGRSFVYVLETSSAFQGPPTIANMAPKITALLYFLSEAVPSFPLLQN